MRCNGDLITIRMIWLDLVGVAIWIDLIILFGISFGFGDYGCFVLINNLVKDVGFLLRNLHLVQIFIKVV